MARKTDDTQATAAPDILEGTMIERMAHAAAREIENKSNKAAPENKAAAEGQST